jgi:hypothetical protein
MMPPTLIAFPGLVLAPDWRFNCSLYFVVTGTQTSVRDKKERAAITAALLSQLA